MSTQITSDHLTQQQQEDPINNDDDTYSSDSEEVDEEVVQLKMDVSKEFSPIKPSADGDDDNSPPSPHSTMYNHSTSSTAEMLKTAQDDTSYHSSSDQTPVNHDHQDGEDQDQTLIADQSSSSAQNLSAHKEAVAAYIQEDKAALESDGEELELDKLPETITVLKKKCAKDGGVRTVYLVGTSHFSKESHKDVRRIIRTVKPVVVVLELCRSRMCFLSMNEQEIMQEAKTLDFGKIRDYIKRNGFVQGFIYTLLLTASAKVTNDLDMAPGGEFRNAFNEALKIPGCSVVLGDRPVDITLRRAIATLSTWQKVKMTYNCLFSNEKLDEQELERYKQKDVLEQLIGELSEEFPGLSRVMVTERDQYLAHSLSQVCDTTEAGTNIVGVVGIGHASGIQANWDKVDEVDINELVKIPVSTPSLTGRVIKYSFYGLVGYGLYRYALPTSFKSFLVDTATKVTANVHTQVSGLLASKK